MKVSELEGAKLDYWVGRAEGVLDVDCAALLVDSKPYFPSTKWAQGGPIIEREEIAIAPLKQINGEDGWAATGLQMQDRDFSIWGPTPLIAAMRCLVASKFGDEVPD